MGILAVFVVIAAIVTAHDSIHTTLNVLDKRGGCQQRYIFHRRCSCGFGREVLGTIYGATEVITTIYIVANPWEGELVTTVSVGLTTDISLGVT